MRAIAAVGTAGLRIARNGDDVIAAIRAGAGITVEVIPGEEEGRLAYLAVKAGLGLDEARWSSSTPAAAAPSSPSGTGRASTISSACEVGAVRYTERFGLAGVVAPEVLRDALAAIAADLTGSTAARRRTPWWGWAAR